MASKFFSPYQESLNFDMSRVADSARNIASMVQQVVNSSVPEVDSSMSGSQRAANARNRELLVNRSAVSSALRSFSSLLSFI